MREILFRGKSIEDNKWVYGDLIREKKSFGKICTRIYRTTNNGWELIDVDSKTIEQYTGLKDKNGTKIFEGDILKFINSDNETSYYDVVYLEADCRWIIRQNGLYQYQDVLDKFVERYMTVANNIYDSPELLEE